MVEIEAILLRNKVYLSPSQDSFVTKYLVVYNQIVTNAHLFFFVNICQYLSLKNLNIDRLAAEIQSCLD